MLRLRKPSIRLVSSAVLLCSSALISAQTNGVLRDLYNNISGSAVSDLTNAPAFPNQPDNSFIDSAFEAPSNFADNYGQRMRALLLPPITGSYVFFICSDDNSVLYLSTDEDPTHKRLIAAQNAWANSRQWNSTPSQKSAAITLTNGLRYYIEALHKEGTGGDNLGVTWQKPGEPAPPDGTAPIPGNYLLPYGLGSPVIAVQPTSITRVEADTASFTVQLVQKLGATYQWQRNSTAIAGATNSVYGFAPVAISDSGSKFTCFITNPFGSTNSAIATLTVNPDTTPPTLVSVGTPGNPQVLTVVFSEPVDPASAKLASNYTINNGVNVLSVTFAMDNRTVILTTTPMVAHTNYTLTVNNVRDRANTPNVILPNTQWNFTLDTIPLDISFVKPAPEPIGPSTRHGPLVISEIMYHPAPRADGKNLEFLELYNSNPFFEDISGYRITGQVEFTFPSNTVMQGRSYLVVAAAPTDLQSVHPVTAMFGPYTNSLSNGSGTLRVLNRERGIVFEVSYSDAPPWPAAADGAGHSLVLARPSLGAANPSAWDASDLIGGSPGVAESIGPNPYRTVVINEVLAHTDPPDLDFVELFNYSSAAVDLSGCILTDDPSTNKFVIPTNTVIQPQGFVYYDETQLGFRLSAAGETVLFKSPTGIRVLDALRFDAQENGVAFGRFPDGAKGFHRLQSKTPGTNNSAPLISSVVIDELMYDPLSGLSDDQYVELYNRTASPVDLSGWSLEDGIKYTIPNGTLLSPNGYLVIAKNAARLLTNYSNLTGANTIGDFSGSLAHGGERVALAMPDDLVSTNSTGAPVTNRIHIVVDDVTYGTGGRWGKWAHGGGSSLELVDPNSDHHLPPNWADSDESGKSAWTTVQYTGRLDNGNGPADSLQIILLGPGECLVDNVEVFVAGGQNLVPNPTFDAGSAGWVAQGNHEDSSWDPATGYNSTGCFHVRATDHGDTGANRIRAALSSALSSGQTATLRAKVRWLKGHPEILLRLKGNWLEAAGNTLAAVNLGTPGAPNSRAKQNAGPAIVDVTHVPVVPPANQTVTVISRVNDQSGIAALFLKYRIDPSTNYTSIAMSSRGAGLFSATLPGQPAGTIAAFTIQAIDNSPMRATTQFPDDAPARECLIRWGDPPQAGTFGTYRVWMTQATLDRWSKREHLSNKPLDCTFIYGNYRAVYNMGGEYSGSPYHAPGYDSPIGNVCDYLFTFSDDDSLLGETDATLQWPGNGGGDNTYQREQTAYWMAEQMGLPYCYRRSVNLFVNGNRRAQLMEDVQQPNGDMGDEFYSSGTGGDLHKVQLWFEFDDAAVNFSANGASLQNFTTTGGQKKLPVYRWTFAKRAVKGSASNYTNLFGLVDAANFAGLGPNYRRQLENALDLENWLKTYAVEHVVGNNDSFAYGGGQNMYAYKPVGDTWKMMIWDIDFAFYYQPPTSDVFQGIGRSCGIDLTEPAYLRRYWQILQDLVNGPLLATRVGPLLDAKYTAMTSNGRTVDSPQAIKDYISQRRASVLGLITSNVPSGFSATAPALSTNRNLISISGVAPIDVRTLTINGITLPVTWTSVSNWSVQLALIPGTNALTVQGWDASSNLVAGASATLSINYTGPVELPQTKVVFNEIMYHPAAPNASFVELYNTSATNAFDLSGWRLNGVDFTFPGGSLIAPGGFLVVADDRLGFAAAYGSTIPLAGIFNGKLDNNGETLRLLQPGVAPAQDLIVDQVRYSNHAPWPTEADGTGSSLQLIDPLQDRWRVANWQAVSTNTSPIRLLIATPGAPNSVRNTLPAFPPLWLNELQAENLTGITNSAGQHVPWLELYNPTTNLVALDGLYLSTDYSNLTRWVFPAVSTINPGQFKVIFADAQTNLSTLSELHTSFELSKVSGSLALSRLYNGQAQVLDFIDYDAVAPNHSYGSFTDGQSFKRQQFYFPTPGGTNNPLSPPITVAINEWMAGNSHTLRDQLSGKYSDWFELYNYGTNPVDLAGFYLTDSPTNPLLSQIPPGYSIPPQGFLLVWADDLSTNGTSDLHVGFKLSKNGESIGLHGSDGQVVDFVSYGVQTDDISEGRFPDGAASIVTLSEPTPRSANFFSTPNTPPVVPAVPNTVLFESQVLSFTAQATDNDLPLQHLTFSLPPGSPVGATIAVDTGLFSWRPSLAQTPSTNLITLRVTDDGLPPLTSTTTFTVYVVARPQVSSILPNSNGGCSLTFNTVPGKLYRVEFKNSLQDSEWQPLQPDTAATAQTLTVLDTSGSRAQRFYRIAVLN